MKLSFAAFLAMATAAVATASEMPPFSAVFSMTNDMENNEVIVWSRDTETGELDYEGSVATGGTGGSIVGPNAQNMPNFPNAPDPFASQDPMVVAGRCLLVCNGGSGTVSSLKIFGPRKVSLAGVYPTNGVLPVSVAALDDLVYVLNSALNGSIQGYRLDASSCQMTAIGDSIELDQTVGPPGLPGFSDFGPETPFGPASPAQIGFTPSGDILVTIKNNDGFPGAGFGSLNHYKIGLDGTTSPDALTVTTMPRPASGPFAFDFNDQGVLLLNEAFIINGFPISPGGVSFWEETDGAYTEVADIVSVEQGFSCWIRWNPVNQCMYVTNSFGDGSISTVRGAAGGGYELVESVAAGLNGPLDLVFSADSKYLYVYSPGFAPSANFPPGQPQMVVYEMASDCSLTLVEEEADGYEAVATRPASTNPTGVAIFPDFNQVSGGGEGMAPPEGLVEAIRSGAFQLRK